MATITAVGVVGANILKVRGATAGRRLQMILPSVSAARIPFSRSSIRITNQPHNNTFLSLCTSPITNPEPIAAPESPSPSPSPSSSSSDKEINIKDAAHMLDIRVGRIIKAWRHEEADSLYVEELDVGEPEPRIICSGLVKYIPIDFLQDRKVVVLANLKPRNMRGVKSSGMLLAASDAAHENVELLEPPEASVAGERVWFGSQEDKDDQPPPATANQIQKKKIWELVQPHLKTDASCNAVLGEHLMQTSAGAIISKSLKNANIA